MKNQVDLMSTGESLVTTVENAGLERVFGGAGGDGITFQDGTGAVSGGVAVAQLAPRKSAAAVDLSVNPLFAVAPGSGLLPGVEAIAAKIKRITDTQGPPGNRVLPPDTFSVDSPRPSPGDPAP